MGWLGTPQYRALMRIEDPYEYRDRLTMPKFLVNATGDQFFLPDSWRFYLADLPGETHVRYVPNADHGLKDTDALSSVAAFYGADPDRHAAAGHDLGGRQDGRIRVRSTSAPTSVTAWRATNPAARDFRLETLGPVWQGTPLEPVAPGVWETTIAAPPAGWSAGLIEMRFPSGSKYPFVFTSGVAVVPDRLPHASPRRTGRAPAASPRHTSADDRDVHHRDRFRHGIRPRGRRPRPRRRGAGLGRDAVPRRRDRSDAAGHVDAAGRRVGAAESRSTTSHVLKTAVPEALRDSRRRPGRRGRRRHRLHRLHDAAGARRRHAADGAARVPRQPARVGQALEAPRRAAARPTGSTRPPRARRGVAAPLRRQDPSEWFFAKALQILDEAPEVYARADRLIEAADWVVWRLTGVETRNACTAGYKAHLPGRRASRRATTSARSTPASPTSSTEAVDDRCRRSAAGPAV